MGWGWYALNQCQRHAVWVAAEAKAIAVMPGNGKQAQVGEPRRAGRRGVAVLRKARSGPAAAGV